MFSFSNVSLQEVEFEIKCLNNAKANTHKSIPVKNLKENIDIIGTSLHRIQQAIENSYFPDKLKLAEISSHHKKEETTNKANYRPISILPSISKVFERIMRRQIVFFIEKRFYLPMCGYRKGYNTLPY